MFDPEVNRRRGLFAMVGSLLWVVTGVLVEFTGGGGTRAEAVLRTVLLNPALLLFIVGLMGFHERQRKRSGRLGAAGFAICLLGTGIMLLGNIAEVWVYKYLYGILEARWTPGWRAMGIGSMILPVGFVLLGLGTLEARVFTGWRRTVPLGFGLILAMIRLINGFGAHYWLLDRSDAVGIALGWMALGYALWSENAESRKNPTEPVGLK